MPLTTTNENVYPAARNAQLVAWQPIPAALTSHPRAGHLLPLIVVAGAVGTDRGHRTFNDRVFGQPVSALQFG